MQLRGIQGKRLRDSHLICHCWCGTGKARFVYDTFVEQLALWREVECGKQQHLYIIPFFDITFVAYELKTSDFVKEKFRECPLYIYIYIYIYI
jgi:hypothetical protein